ncbi:DUF4258 domain-containing protein [Pricia sp.]|uniref:DUF4258 domain-containing protein n=1 Tax=Pricia sp. TaxID=2268138 RepID=UPI003592FBF4
MAFLKRLGFYLVGLSIGIVFLTIFLKKKSEETGVEFCYFPNCRTLKDIRSKQILYSEDINRMLADKQLDSLDITTLLTDGEVDFGRSDTKSEACKTYFIKGFVKEREAVLKVRNCQEKVSIEGITSE